MERIEACINNKIIVSLQKSGFRLMHYMEKRIAFTGLDFLYFRAVKPEIRLAENKPVEVSSSPLNERHADMPGKQGRRRECVCFRFTRRPAR